MTRKSLPQTAYSFVFSALLALMGSLALANDAGAQSDGEGTDRPNSVLTRPSLLDGPDGLKQALRQRGVVADLWWTQFNQSLLEGDGNHDWQYGGKIDLILTVDLHKWGLWPGLSVNIHREWLYGEDVNSQGDGTFLPLNVAMGFPRLGGFDEDTSWLITQKLGKRASVTVGKFNMLDAVSRTPLIGGGGLDTFMHLGLAAPVSGVTPPYLFGASASLSMKRVNFGLMIYDPRNAQDWDVIANPFEEGVTTSLSASVPLTIGGKRGIHSFRGVYSTEEGIDLRDVPQLALPPELRDEPRSRAEPWFLSYSFQQYLHHDPNDPSKGWGIFGQVGVSDGNPNPFQGHFFIGVGGNSFLPGRSNDRWGVAYFQQRLDDALREAALRDLRFSIGTENGVEVYYNLALAPWFRVTANLQFIEPFPDSKEDTVFGGVRTQVKF